MRLLPEDLGTKWHILTARNRSLGMASAWVKPTDPRLGVLGKRWIKGLPVSPEVAAETLPLTKNKTINTAWTLGAGLGWIFPFLAVTLGGDTLLHGNIGGFLGAETLTLGLGTAYAYGTFIGLPRAHLRKLHETPVREEEITPFLTGNVPGLPHVFGEMAGKLIRFLRQQGANGEPERDPLEASYLSLVRNVIRTQNVPKDHEDELRAAIRAIGEALCRLPPIGEIENAGSNLLAADQREEARTLHARAERERDPVVAGSLQRQANALENAARASEGGAQVARRVRALRQELRAQMEVLRLTLPSWGRPEQTHATSYSARGEHALGDIAEAVQSVAREAVAMSDAHEELDEFLNGRANGRTYDTKPPEEVQTLRVR